MSIVTRERPTYDGTNSGRRFQREAAANGNSLQDVPSMLEAAVRLAAAAGIATGVGVRITPAPSAWVRGR
jgi:hypothetical protein